LKIEEESLLFWESVSSLRWVRGRCL